MFQVRVVKTEEGLAVLLPPHAATKLSAEEGTRLFLVDSPLGYVITPVDPLFADQMTAASSVMEKYRDALSELAE